LYYLPEINYNRLCIKEIIRFWRKDDMVGSWNMGVDCAMSQRQLSEITQEYSYLIRNEMKTGELRMRAPGEEPKKLAEIQKELRRLHAFEVMAVNIYRMQIKKNTSDLACKLIKGMGNEMTHVQDFQIKLYEYNSKPSPLRWVAGLAGIIIGLASSLGGEKAIVKSGIWLEERAVEHYEKVIKNVPWDKDTLAVIEKNLSDECHHINTWRNYLENMS
jgi:demethoxyubiquinone hydroxylase (CLK1/Coq7/Cat5 family)